MPSQDSYRKSEAGNPIEIPSQKSYSKSEAADPVKNAKSEILRTHIANLKVEIL